LKGARIRSLSWRLCRPLRGSCCREGGILPDWLKDIRTLRGSVFFDNGRRQHFRTEDGRFFDYDPIDPYAYHVLGYDGARLVGCVRVYRLVPNGPACVTEKFLGQKRFAEMLYNLEVQREATIEIGRWIVHPGYRASGRPGVQLAAGSAALAKTLESGSGAQRGIVLCSVGTGDRQDLMLVRIGLAPVPTAEPINCEEFKDKVRVMYCANTQELNPRFLRIMDEMATILGLTQALCKVQPHGA
jgi:N-acyl-L-homoserine lactone synthetase